MKIFFAVHGFPPRANAGTENYVHALAHALRSGGDELTVLAREFDPARPELATRRERVDGLDLIWLNNGFRACRTLEDTYRNAAIRALAGRLLDELKPDVAHLHHLTGLTTDLVFELEQRGIPTVLTLNDFWMICQRGQLLDLELERCAGPTPEGCARCLHSDTVSAARRIEHVRTVLDKVSVLLCPSRTMRERFAVFGVAEERLRLQEQGIELAPFGSRPPSPGGPLRVAFAGSLMVSKAPHLLLEAVAGLPPGLVTLTVAGSYSPYHGDDRYRATFDAARSRVAVDLQGAIGRAEVANLLLRSDVLVVPSIWIENAPFVIKEAYAAGVPVVASDLGGMAELVRHEVSGLLFAPGDARALGGALRRLADDPGLLDRLRRGIPPVKSMAQDAAETHELYRSWARAAT